MATARVDVAVLTVIPAELKAALAALGLPDKPRKLDSGTNTWQGTLESSRDERAFRIALACIANAGNYDCAAAATEMLLEFRPRMLILVGIAAGMRGRVKIGEVVLSERVVAYESAALVPGAEIPRPEGTLAAHSVQQDVAAYLVQPYADRIAATFPKRPKADPKRAKEHREHVARAARVLDGTIASGEKLLRDPAKLTMLRERLHGKIEIGEMEASGLAAACRRHRVPWLVVRGISDFGDKFKHDGFHTYAAGAAAKVLADFLVHGLSLDAGNDETGEDRDDLAREAAKLVTLSLQGAERFSSQALAAATARYEHLALEACDIIDLAGLPEDDRNIAMKNFVMRQLYVPLRLQSVASSEETADSSLTPPGRAGVTTRSLSKARSGTELVPLGVCLTKTRRLVILGDPGGGKSTLLRWIATAYLLRLKSDPHYKELPDVKTLPDVDWLPIVIRCRDLDDGCLTGALDDVLRQTLRKAELSKEEVEALQVVLRKRLLEGAAILMIDGLDEIADARTRARFCKQLQVMARAYPAAPLVVTSRVVGYREMGFRLDDFEHKTLAELSPGDKEEFARRWCTLTEPPERRKRMADELIEGIQSSVRIENLTGNPMLLTTMALVKRKVGRLPHRRSELYAEAVQVLLNWRREVDEPLDHREALPQLEYVAHEMCRRGEQRLSEPEVIRLLEAVREDYPNIRAVGNRSPEEFLTLIERRTSILVQAGRIRDSGQLVPVYEFRHLTFQEYLAGRALIDGRYRGYDRSQSLAERVAPLAASTAMASSSRIDWREALRLCVAGCKDDDVDDVLAAIMTPASTEPLESVRSRAVLAALCLADEPNASDAAGHKVMDALVALIEKGGDRFYRDDIVRELGASTIWGAELREKLLGAFLSSPLTRTDCGGLFGGLVARRTGRSLKPASYTNVLASDDRRTVVATALEIMHRAYRYRTGSKPSSKDAWLPLASPLLKVLNRAWLSQDAAAATAAAWALAWVTGAFRSEGASQWEPAEREIGWLGSILESGACEGYLLRFVGVVAGTAAAKASSKRRAAIAASLASKLTIKNVDRGLLVQALGETRDPSVVPILTKLLRDENAGVRRQSLKALADANDDGEARLLLSFDPEIASQWVDPILPIAEDRLRVVAANLKVSPDVARARLEVVARGYGLGLEWKERPGKGAKRSARSGGRKQEEGATP